MELNQALQDWLIRYGIILAKRYTSRQKTMFTDSLSIDLKNIRSDITIDRFANQGTSTQNLYVGDPKKAKKIIVTPYDTPPWRFGNYQPFNPSAESKQTYWTIVFTSIAYILLGLIYTWFVAMPLFSNHGLLSFWGIFHSLFYIIYFVFLGQIVRGIPTKYTMVLNTSGILLLLTTIANDAIYSDEIVFAFVDGGLTNGSGLDRVIELNSEAEYLYIDSIGANAPLWYLSSKDFYKTIGRDWISKRKVKASVSVLFSGDKVNDHYELSKHQLRNRNLNEDNMNRSLQIILDFIRG